MNELNELLKMFVEMVKTVNGEIPPTLQEIVRWGIVGNGLTMVGAGLLCFASVKMWQKGWKLDREGEDEPAPFIIISGIAIPALTSLFVYSLYNMLQAWIAPRVYLLKYLKGMMQ